MTTQPWTIKATLQKPQLKVAPDPILSNEPELETDYLDVMRQLKERHMQYIETCGPGKTALDEAIDAYDPVAEELLGRLAEIYSRKLQPDEVGEAIEKTQRALYVAAMDIKDTYDAWKANRQLPQGNILQ